MKPGNLYLVRDNEHIFVAIFVASFDGVRIWQQTGMHGDLFEKAPPWSKNEDILKWVPLGKYSGSDCQSSIFSRIQDLGLE